MLRDEPKAHYLTCTDCDGYIEGGLPIAKRLTIVLILGAHALMFTACAPRKTTVPGNTEGAATSAVELPAWPASSDCSSCHATEAQSASDNAATYSFHADQPGMQRVTCHVGDDDALSEAHADYATAKRPLHHRRAGNF
jgi:hypothetical protein